MHLRGRAALAHARESASPDRLLRAARREGKRLLREKMSYCTPHGQHLLAGVAILRGDRIGAAHLLEQAAKGYEAVEMIALAAAVRCRIGELRGDDDGQRMIDEAHAYFRRQGAANPERMIDALAVSCSL
jgi:hypothetical protein